METQLETRTLMVLDLTNRRATTTELAVALRDDALSQSALIGKVGNAEENAEATNALQNIHTLLAKIEKARAGCKAPVLEIGKVIDATAREFTADLAAEKNRLCRLQGDWLALEAARVASENAARNKALLEMERERERKLAEAKSHEQRDAVQAAYCEKAQAISQAQPAAVPQMAKGQTVREEWEVEVFDLHALYRSHPNAVKLTPMMTEIRALLDLGIKPAGVRAEKVIKAGVRQARGREVEV